jgi:DNA polymerase, archaea type
VGAEFGGGGGLHEAGPDLNDPMFRTGAALIGEEADSRALYEERDVARGEKRAASRHEQELAAGDVDAGKIDDSIRAIDEFTAMTAVDDKYRFKPEREYYHGWSEGAGVVLLYRTETGTRKREFVPYDWYFFVRAEEAKRVPPESWDWLVNKRRWADRVEPDPEFPEKYWRIYVDRAMPKFDPQYYFSRIGSDSARYSWAVPFYLGERPQSIRFPIDRDRWKPYHKVINWLRKKDVEPLEADLSVKQRFMTDYDLRIKPTYHMMFVDIETDDSIGGFDQKEEARILSIAWEGSDFEATGGADAGFLLLAEETDEAEEAMLREFRDRIKAYDVIAAWNGFGFDFPVIFARFHRYGIRIDWRYYLFADPLPVFKRHYIRAGSHATSYALDAIGLAVLKMPKLPWRKDFADRHPDVPPQFIELYRREPDLLEAYNKRDVEILRKLEEFTGFVNIEQIFCRIANGFANDWNISTKVDQLLLKKGRKDGFHYPTRFWSSKIPEQYEGAYVFPPKVGMHLNVGSFDFKSLYPSMVRSFNISPEMIVRSDEVDELKAAGVPLCRCPRFIAEGEENEKGGTYFRKSDEGFISQMFVQTLERRKKYTDLQAERLKVTGTTQDDLFLLYYRLAYSFKRMGLSFYGDMGNSRSRYYDTELAEAITLSGQFFILQTAKYARKFGYEPLYGDTDSIYIQLAPDDREWPSDEARIADLVRIGDDFVDYCQERYREHLIAHDCNLEWNSVILEYEDVMDRVFFIVKKRYAGRMLSHKGVATDHVEVKGLEVMRGDTSLLTRNLQQAVLDAILMKQWDGARIERELVAPEFKRVTAAGLPVEELVIAKGISKDPDAYKSTPLHVKLATWIRDFGQQFFVGMKVEYVVTKAKPKLEGVLVEHYQPDVLPYDPEYYWDRVIYPASLRILDVCFPDVDWDFWRIEVRRRRAKLLERYKRWFLQKKNVAKAISQIRENKKGWLGPDELVELRRAPKVKVMI